MDQVTVKGQHDFSRSRSGRLLIPRLKTWTGEKVTVSNQGHVEVTEGKPDFTSTFKSERAFLRMEPSFNLSQVLVRSQEMKQRKMAKSFSEYDSAKQLHPINLKVKPGKILERNNADRNKTPTKRNSMRISEKCNLLSTVPSFKTMPLTTKGNQRKKVLVTKTKTPSPRKTLRKQRSQRNEDEFEIDIFGPEFQPVVVMVRLLPEQILSLTEKKCEKLAETPKKKSADPKRKKHPDIKRNARQKAKLNQENTDLCCRLSNQRQPRTVKETQQLLSFLNRSKDCEVFEDEAASTAAFFQNSPSRTDKKLLSEAAELLNDDFECNDNLSMRTLSERESSPMSSAVSPIGSLHEIDAEISGREDSLMRGSPILENASEFRRAKLLHRTIKGRAKLLKKAQKNNHCQEDFSSDLVIGTSTPSSSQLLKPRMIRALEKDLKEKATSSRERWDFSTYYRGNLLHVSINSDSDESSTVDPLDEI
ncbi:uncharacterized protein LOC124203192 isoform X3 [Daphnia pulex]|uniref:uncharacterized protein LOC124203192 isoform X3 n=1 Tax=Daphnia pulex TaxID=6669 RepID=UPI001EDCBC4F|nr:uncharacterized protein LOC124203192 isoform X3 [Daphnia pulex]